MNRSVSRRPLALRLAVSATALALALAACGGDDGGGTTSTDAAAESTTTTTVVLTSEGALRARPVVSLMTIDNLPLNPFGGDQPDDTMVSPNIDSTVAYDLGPSPIDESDVASAVARQDAGDWHVAVTLTDDATARLKALGRTCAEKEAGCESGLVAITVDGFVLAELRPGEQPVTAELVLGTGRVGKLGQQQAEAIAAALAP